jgi:predicted small lipoprotein YifL
MNSTPSPSTRPPQRKRTAVVAPASLVAVLTAFSLAGCGQGPDAAPADNPAVISEVPGTDLHRLTLTEQAVERTGIQTSSTALDPKTHKLTVPYGAIIYDSSGKTWVYTNPEPRVYVRQAITVERINGQVAQLKAGPRAGTVVVTTGAEELLGTEFDTAE